MVGRFFWSRFINLALYAFQGATDSSCFALFSLEGEVLGERGNSLKFHLP